MFPTSSMLLILPLVSLDINILILDRVLLFANDTLRASDPPPGQIPR